MSKKIYIQVYIEIYVVTGAGRLTPSRQRVQRNIKLSLSTTIHFDVVIILLYGRKKKKKNSNGIASSKNRKSNKRLRQNQYSHSRADRQS